LYVFAYTPRLFWDHNLFFFGISVRGFETSFKTSSIVWEYVQSVSRNYSQIGKEENKMRWKRGFLFLVTCTFLLVSISQAVSATTDESSQTNIALNPSRSGYPSPLESDQGWGGGSYPWDLVDGLRDYPGEWMHGLAFTGGNWYPPLAGVKQATINFGGDHTFNKVIIWHHTYVHIPAEVNLQYWDGSIWKSINFQRDLNLTYQPSAGYADTLIFEPVTSSKVRYSFDNRLLNINGTQIEHGWIYEFEVYEYVDTNQPPIANAGGPYQADEGSPVTFDASSSSDPDGDVLQYRWDFESDGTWTSWSSEPTITHTWDDNWSGSTTLEVSDGEFTSTDTATVTIGNANPVVEAGEDKTVNEGDSVSFSGSYTDAGSADTHTFLWDFGDDTTISDTLNPTHVYAENGIYTATLTVTDDDGGVGTDTVTITVNNVNPSVGEIEAPIYPTSLKTPIITSCTFTDAGLKDTHTGIWNWGDGASSEGVISETNGEKTIIGEHTYAGAGVYWVTLTVTDDDGGSSSVTTENYVVIYNPEGGFVTGGGWINSPAGAFVSDDTLEGKATFGFVSKYEKGATVPAGKTEFQFKVADLNFKSTSYDWLVVAGSKAKYKGTGTINGGGNYGFMLSAVDGEDGIDMFRIKIWNKDLESDNIIYDNEINAAEDAYPSTAISGGSIVVHKE
jgi:PKD repeat protein